MTITIDGNNFDNLDEFYKEIEKHLEQGECPWGQNLDSLDGIVQCSFNYTDNKDFDVKKVIWLNAEVSKNKLGEVETIKWLTKKFDYSSDSKYQFDLKQRIERVKNKNEPTLFDTIIEIFKSNKNIKLQWE